MRKLKKLAHFTLTMLLLLALASMGSHPARADAPPKQPESKTYWAGGYFEDTTDPYVNLAYELGIVHGFADGAFRPDDCITEAQFARMCFNAFCNNKDAYGTGEKWWQPAEWWLFDATVQPHYGLIDIETYSDLCVAYGYDFDPDAPASYEWMIDMLYLLFINGAGEAPSANFREDAYTWAFEHDFDPLGFWRFHDSPVSVNDFLAQPDYLTRCEAVELLIGLCELS